jgi:hypothetical protein
VDASHSFEPGRPPLDARNQRSKLSEPPPSWGIQEDAPPAPREFERSAALDGCSFSAPRRVPVLACLLSTWTIAAGCSFLIEPQNWIHVCFAISSIPAFFAAIWRFVVWRRYRVHFTKNGVQTFGPREFLAYREIMEVYAPDEAQGGDTFDIYLLHAYGCLRISKDIGPHGRVILGFLRAQWLAERENPAVPFFLQPFVEEANREHGAENTIVYRSRFTLKNQETNRTGEYVTGWMFGGGFVTAMLIVLATVFLSGDPDFKNMPAILQMAFMALMTIVLLSGFGFAILEFRRWFSESVWSVRTILGWNAETVLIVTPAGINVQSGRKSILATWDELRTGSNAGISMCEPGDASSTITVWRNNVRIRLHNEFQWPIRHAMDHVRDYLNLEL